MSVDARYVATLISTSHVEFLRRIEPTRSRISLFDAEGPKKPKRPYRDTSTIKLGSSNDPYHQQKVHRLWLPNVYESSRGFELGNFVSSILSEMTKEQLTK
ncbi:uncharacterized protein Z520_04269 [Fonsecaea multimorphosa CBS 102226]|uniref:Uncharacterized protein n=1 Tax=Fonsecaea multimorphosa CBS 102226 TaxID=1442371 RepID=A0A0D2HCK3_9EURO|nr:uncharacterized protein Z520_04269 [Fonsecaea multimorphosa CBS 102226]KIX99635.1 hypothetical protein Z520_04269 [Fonsecaea multimorphosa CBS 102226]